MDPAKLNAMKVPELKSALQERGLSTAGLKAELVERLNAALLAGDGAGGAEAEAAAAAAPPTAETASASDPALDEAPVCAPAGPSSGFPATEAPAVETPAVAAEPAATGGAEAAAPAAAAPTEAGTKRDASEMDSGAQESDQAARSRRLKAIRICRTRGNSTSHRARESPTGTIQTRKRLPGSVRSPRSRRQQHSRREERLQRQTRALGSSRCDPAPSSANIS